MFKNRDKVRFVGKNAGNYGVEAIKKDYGVDVTKEPCYGIIADTKTYDDTVICDVYDGIEDTTASIGKFVFRQGDLIKFNAVDYDALNEIEE